MGWVPRVSKPVLLWSPLLHCDNTLVFKYLEDPKLEERTHSPSECCEMVMWIEISNVWWTEKFVFCQDTASYFSVLPPQQLMNDFFCSFRKLRPVAKEKRGLTGHTYCKIISMKIQEISAESFVIGTNMTTVTSSSWRSCFASRPRQLCIYFLVCLYRHSACLKLAWATIDKAPQVIYEN